MTLRERLDRYSMPEPNSGCHLWLASVNPAGYGRLRYDGEARLAHRLSWMVEYGPIPTGMCVCHKCDVPACINPNHLWLGTRYDNSTDMRRKGRSSDGRPRPSARGSLNGNSRYSEETMLAVRLASGRHADIAARFGVSKTLVGYVKRGIQWGYLAELVALLPEEKRSNGAAA